MSRWMSLDINVYYVKPTEIEQVQFTVITLLQACELDDDTIGG